MTGKRIIKAALLAAALLFLCLSAGAETVLTLRVKPAETAADRETGGGYCFVGEKGKTEAGVTLTWREEGRTETGKDFDLRQLLKDGEGAVVRAVWRFEARETAAKKNLFRLTAGEEGKEYASERVVNGWNAWDVTEFARDALKGEGGMAFRAEPGNGKAKKGTELDAAGSALYVTVALRKAVPGAEDQRITDEPLLDAALSALPEGHLILRQYDEVSGSLLQAKWPTGVPYYYGGHSEDKVLRRFYPMQESNYYKKDRMYLCGFDCGSYLHWAEEQAGCEPHDALSSLMYRRDGYLPVKGLELREWWPFLRPGDMIAVNHGSYHVMMYIGTPKMYGLTAENAPELKDRLEEPLVIHCGENPFCYELFKEYIDAQQWQREVSPPDGGVTVSLLMQNAGNAPHVKKAPWGTEYGYFELPGQEITALSLHDCTDVCWFRPAEAER